MRLDGFEKMTNLLYTDPEENLIEIGSWNKHYDEKDLEE